MVENMDEVNPSKFLVNCSSRVRNPLDDMKVIVGGDLKAFGTMKKATTITSVSFFAKIYRAEY